MIFLYLALVLLGVGLSVAHSRRRTGRTWIAALGTALAALAIPTGFSVGPYVAAAAVLALVVAVARLRPRGRAA